MSFLRWSVAFSVGYCQPAKAQYLSIQTHAMCLKPHVRGMVQSNCRIFKRLNVGRCAADGLIFMIKKI